MDSLTTIVGASTRSKSSRVSDKIIEWRQRAYELLEQGAVGSRAGALAGGFIIVVVVVSLLAVTLESVPRYAREHHALFETIEVVTLIVLSIEFLCRLWISIEHPLYRHLSPLRARLAYLASAPALIDLIAVLPFWLTLVFPSEFQVLLVLRVIRFLKLGRYSPAMRSLLDAIYAERRALAGCFVILLGTSLVAATVMHLIEAEAQPDKFGTIPEAMWWAIVTLGTIGYGDVVPITTLGRIVAAGTIFVGLIMVALPIGIIASAFSEDIHRRAFVVTWGMVARVPLFAGLDAVQIAEIMRLLQSQRYEAGAVIARRGEPAHSMYFVAAGEVEIIVRGESIRLRPGHFFGEVAVLRKAHRSATAQAVAPTSLLVLDARDVHMLMEREPTIAERIRRTARERVGSIEPKGDIAAQEIVESEEEETNG
jgi:voltage-gated potassium channel